MQGCCACPLEGHICLQLQMTLRNANRHECKTFLMKIRNILKLHPRKGYLELPRSLENLTSFF